MLDLSSPWLWFNLFLAAMLALDLGVFNRRAHRISSKEALIWSAVWLVPGADINAGIYYFKGGTVGLEWTTGYFIEKALSVDNIFVFALLMAAFGVPEQYQHKLLYCGVIGALIMRLAIIGTGSYLLHHFHWVLYAFGAFLVFTGIRMFTSNEELHPEHGKVVAWLRRVLPVTSDFREGKFFVRENNGLLGTPLLLALQSIEITDLVFATDSIPAIFAVTDDAFVVYTSNAFAILGLRTLYFLLADALNKFYYLKHGLGIVLSLVGLKMLVRDFIHIDVLWMLLAVVGVILGSIIYSLRRRIESK